MDSLDHLQPNMNNFDDGFSQSYYNTPYVHASIESSPELSGDEFYQDSSRGRSLSPYMSAPNSRQSSRQTSPGMDSRPTRKQNTPGTLDLDIPLAYTPTTHRVSKAKKGKKVHVCEYGCGKIFTRAEHRKRHEANHKPDPLFKCHIEGCHKPFQRRDLLDRHLERQHGIMLDNRRRASSVASVSSSLRASPVPSMGYSNSPAMLGYSNPNTPALGQHLAPNRARAYSQPIGSYEFPATDIQRSFTPDFVNETEPMLNHGGFYQSPDLAVPSPPYNQQKQNYDNFASIDSSFDAYPTIEGLGLDLSGGQFPAHVAGFGDPSTSYASSGPSGPSSPYASDLPIGHLVSGSSTTASSTALGVGEDIDEHTRSHYEVCYWEAIDSIFPILHYGTWIATGPAGKHPALRTIVCALGAQASPRPLARQHSAQLFDEAQLALNQLVPPAPDALVMPLELLQLTFLVEYLPLYRFRMPGVYNSPRFAAVFSSLVAAASTHSLQDRDEFYSTALEADSPYLEAYHASWIDLESRRRILSAALILDVHRAKLFEQRPVAPPGAADIVSSCSVPASSHLWTADPARWHAFTREPPHTGSGQTYFHLSLTHAISLSSTGTIALQTPPDALTLALQLATHTPVRALLVSAAGAWLFTRKVSEHSWALAKAELRAWARGQDASVAAWLAAKVLKEYLLSRSPPHPSHLQSRAGIVRLEMPWALYLAGLVLWAYTELPAVPASYSEDGPEPVPGPERASTMPNPQPGPLSPPLILLSSEHASSSAGSTGSSRPGASRSAKAKGKQPEPISLRAFLTRFDWPTWQDVVALRGSGGAQVVLTAVKGTLVDAVSESEGVFPGSQALVLAAGCAVAEAVGVLGRLEGGRVVMF